jgi:glyoxylase-like metal-dependent hydrolase (beta-lactamase superfamily II)
MFMQQLYPDLWQTPAETRFSTLTSHAYVLTQNVGVMMIYAVQNGETLIELASRWDIAWQGLSHNHEIDDSLQNGRLVLNTKMVGHAAMQPFFKEQPGLDIAPDLGPGEDCRFGQVQMIYTPGHTNNNVCYYYASPHGKRYLFTGDTLYLDKGAWKTIIMRGDGGDLEQLDQSLARLGRLQVDVLITSVAVGEMEIQDVMQDQWQTIIERARAELRA